MQPKTKVHAEDGRQELLITREFDLPVELVFKAYTEPDILEQWMGTRVVKLENEPHGSWRFETSGPDGTIVFQAHGVIHEFLPNQRITRTFEMENAGFAPQLEFLKFDELTAEKSRLSMQIVFKSVALRDQLLKMPFAQGINMAHNKLQEIVNHLK